MGLGNKEADLELALQALDPSYRLAFVNRVLVLADSGRGFTADDVVLTVGLPRASRTNANNGVGALMNYCARQGWIHKTGRYVPSARPQANGRVVAEWKGHERLPGM